MGLGKQIRLNRIFGNPSGRLCSVAVDHLVSYQQGLPQGLTNVPETIATLMKGKPDAITMYKGMAEHAWGPYAGSIPLIITSIAFTLDDTIMHQLARPSECIPLGADAISAAITLRSSREGDYLKMLAGIVEEARPYELPVIAHIYPRDFRNGPRIVHDPENILWAVRCGIECGADVIKVPYTGSPDTFREIIATSPVPVVAAGGPKADSLLEALRLMAGVIQAGARGATIGRNIWGDPDPARALLAFKHVIHDGLSAADALTQSETAPLP
ncbi:MAG: aldolase [Candidatus Hydrogenedentes bacterium]|nr:aldolase [Candidatus Hydrogenedentota bacterium]